MSECKLPENSRRKVLVIHPGALGDVLLARPALQALHRRFSKHEIAFLGGRAVGTLLHECGEVSQVFPIELAHLSELFAGVECLSPPFLDWLKHVDTVVGWLADTDGAAAATLQTVGVQSIQFRPALSASSPSEHQTDRYCEAFGLEVLDPMVYRPLTVPLVLRGQAKRILETLNVQKGKPLVVIHAGSGSARKCIDSWRLAQVVDWVSRSGATPLLLEGPADHDSVAAVLSELKHAVPVVRGESVSLVAGVLSHAALYIGQDSGVTLLAAGLAIPTVACFGPTDPHRWAPRGPHVTVLTGSRCSCHSWREVESCGERTCLQISPDCLIEASRMHMMEQFSLGSGSA